MGVLFKKYKTRFRYALKPVFAMLASRQKEMEPGPWSDLLTKTRESIVNNPAEFLGPDLPEKQLMLDILEEIFKEFDYDLKIKKRSALKK
jgi:predicted solute-binding protein